MGPRTRLWREPVPRATDARAPSPPGFASDGRGSVDDDCAGSTPRPPGSAPSAIRNDEQRIAETPAAHVLEERPAALRVLLGARAQCQEDLLALLVDAPRAEDRFAVKAGTEPLGDAVAEKLEELSRRVAP